MAAVSYYSPFTLYIYTGVPRVLPNPLRSFDRLEIYELSSSFLLAFSILRNSSKAKGRERERVGREIAQSFWYLATENGRSDRGR